MWHLDCKHFMTPPLHEGESLHHYLMLLHFKSLTWSYIAKLTCNKITQFITNGGKRWSMRMILTLTAFLIPYKMPGFFLHVCNCPCRYVSSNVSNAKQHLNPDTFVYSIIQITWRSNWTTTDTNLYKYNIQ